MVIDPAHEIEELAKSGDLVSAKKLASEWTSDEPNSASAWRELAYVQQLLHDLDGAGLAINHAHRLAPNDVGYLFEKGVIEYKSELNALAAQTFGICAEQSIELGSDYYLDAAKIAKGLSLLNCGDFSSAKQAIDGVSPDAATWVTGRLTAQQLRATIDRKEKLPKPIRF